MKDDKKCKYKEGIVSFRDTRVVLVAKRLRKNLRQSEEEMDRNTSKIEIEVKCEALKT
jgi:hypothetical protein